MQRYSSTRTKLQSTERKFRVTIAIRRIQNQYTKKATENRSGLNEMNRTAQTKIQEIESEDEVNESSGDSNKAIKADKQITQHQHRRYENIN